MSLDQFASTGGDGVAPRPKPIASGPQETEEDLFNFDELLGATKQKAALNQALDDVLAAVEVAKVEVSKDVAPAPAKPTTSATVPPTPASVAPAPAARVASPAAPSIKPVAPAPVGVAAASVGAPSGPPGAVVHQKLSMSPLAALLLGGIVLANVTLMAFAWNSVQSVKQLVLDVSHDVADTTSELRAESSRRTELAALESEPVFGALPEGYRTLELAKERMTRGEHARARRMLYGLLAIVDRIEQPARGEVEAQAGFLIADSFRMEADALGGGRRP